MGDGKEGAGGQDHEDADATETSTETQGGGGEEGNTAPVANLTVWVGGNLTLDEGNGVVVPADVEVELDASGSYDPQNDTLYFEWTVDGEPEAEDTANITRTFTAGNHTVTLNVTDGELESSIERSIVAEGGAGAVPDVAVLTYEFKDAFAAAADESIVNQFDVPAGAKRISAWLKWDDGVTGNTPLLSDLDLYLQTPAGADAGKAENFFNYEFVREDEPEGLESGLWTADVTPYLVGHDTDWELHILVWFATPTEVTFTGNEAGLNLGPGDDEITGNVDHATPIPDGTTVVAARLAWTTGGQGAPSRLLNDYDLYAFAGGEEQFRSGGASTQEYGFKVAEEGEALPSGDWSFTVVPFSVSTADYTLTIEYA